MTTSEYLLKLNKVEKIACSSKWNRLLNNPYKYINAILFKEIVYPLRKKELRRHTAVFFDKKMLIALPASTDIYLTGGKSHDSEIRLAKYLILNLSQGQSFLDIGAHYGYFTLMAANLVGKEGAVQCYEPSRGSYSILNENCNNNELKNIKLFHNAVSDKKEKITFYEFPNLYSEYNAASIEQFEEEQWFRAYKPEKVTVDARTIDSIVGDDNFHPDIIKIDVEGAEFKVITGAQSFLKAYSPHVVMEYLSVERNNEEHKKAADLFAALNYVPHIINDEGKTVLLNDIDAYLKSGKLESDNIVFKKLQ